MYWGILCEDDNSLVEPYCADHDIAVRDMYDTSVNTQWNIQYEAGDFWNLNQNLGDCIDSLNDTWWTGNGKLEENMFVDEKKSSFGTVFESVSPAMVSMYICMAVVAMLFIAVRFVRWSRK